MCMENASAEACAAQVDETLGISMSVAHADACSGKAGLQVCGSSSHLKGRGMHGCAATTHCEAMLHICLCEAEGEDDVSRSA